MTATDPSVADAPADRGAGPLRAARRRAAAHLLERTRRRAEPLPPDVLEAPTAVLAPHPDDEVLGAGGVIAHKRRAGIPVTVIFMTDGAASHARFVGRSELATRRRREALAACAVLGVPAEDVHFLDVPDGSLAEAVPEAVASLAAILEPVDPTLLVVPHPAEPPADHEATFRVVERWAAPRAAAVDLLLYPVWLWDQWPFTNPLSPPSRSSAPAIVRTAVAHRGGAGLGRLLDHRLDIDEVLPVKRAALAEHASQMVRPADEPDWPTLADVAAGDWLDLLLQPVELYSLRRPGMGAGRP